MQETVAHVTAVVEFVMRCAYTLQDSESLDELLEGIRHGVSDAGGRVLQLERSSLSPKKVYDCLQQSVAITHRAIVTGTGIAGCKYARKSLEGSGRILIPLWAMMRMLLEVMDAVIFELSKAISERIGSPFTEMASKFEMQMTNILKSVDNNKAYQQIGTGCYSGIGVVPDSKSPHLANQVLFSEPFRYTPMRLGQTTTYVLGKIAIKPFFA